MADLLQVFGIIERFVRALSRFQASTAAVGAVGEENRHSAAILLFFLVGGEAQFEEFFDGPSEFVGFNNQN